MKRMSKELAQAIVDSINESGNEASIYEEYSGRGMFGKTTTGIVTDDSRYVFFALGQLVNDKRFQDLESLVEKLSEDTMGRYIIVY